MKKCPYCGAEYPDDVTACAIDTQILLEHPPKPKAEPAAVPAPAANPAGKVPTLIWPDYRWSSRDAWKCIGIIICFEFIRLGIDHVVYLAFPTFYGSSIGFLFRRIFVFATWTITACYFARTETFDAFLRAFGFDRRPTGYAWFGITMVLLLRLSTHLMFAHHLGPGVYNYELTAFRKTFGPEKWLFQFSPLILAPLFEEAVNRGFLYKAFRQSCSMPVSMIVMVAWTCWTHWGYYYESWIAALELSVWTVLQCYLREKSNSLWDCVLTHFVSNAIILFWAA